MFLRLASERCAEDDCPFIRLCLLVGCFANHALACREDKWRLEAEANIFVGEVGRVLRVEVWFDNARNTGRWEPTYFTKLLTLAELRSKSFVSKQPPAGYGGMLVGVYRPPNPRAMLLPWIGVSAPVTAVVNFSKPA